MSQASYSSLDLFAFGDNHVPPVIRDCFIGLIGQLEGLFEDGRVPGGGSGGSPNIPDPTREPIYGALSTLKRDWLEWISMEVKVRLAAAVRYYNLRGAMLDPANTAHTPIILFLRKFRRVDTGLVSFGGEDPRVVLREMGALQMAVEPEFDTVLRGKIECRFPSCPVMWIANPRDALSFSGYFTREPMDGDYRLNENSVPFVVGPMWAAVRPWQEAANCLIRASDAIVLANTSADGGLQEELDLLCAAEATGRTFATHPEKLGASFPRVGRVEDLTEERLHSAGGADKAWLGRMAGWGHWAGFDSLKYARQYIEAIDDLWGRILDSGTAVSPGYFAALYTALVALLVFRGELGGAASIGRGLAGAITGRSRGLNIGITLRDGEFHTQDLRCVEMLAKTSDWYAEHDALYRLVTGLPAPEGSPPSRA